SAPIALEDSRLMTLTFKLTRSVSTRTVSTTSSEGCGCGCALLFCARAFKAKVKKQKAKGKSKKAKGRLKPDLIRMLLSALLPFAFLLSPFLCLFTFAFLVCIVAAFATRHGIRF